MAHSDEHITQKSHGRAFAIGIGLNVTFVAVELFFGLLANSSALLADAGHNASDVLSLVFAWAAIGLASIKPKGKYTYGLRKTTILVSVLNALLLFGAVIAIAWNAIDKFKNPQPVAGIQVMIVAGTGVVINTITALLFMSGQKDDLNIKGAFMHMAADAAVSSGVLVGGLLIYLTGIQWIDPVMSFIIIGVILWGTLRLFADSINLALDAVPKHIELEKVYNFILSQNGVEGIHDLHVWAMSTTQTALTAHLIMPKGSSNEFISNLQEKLKHEFGIGHTTLQIENELM
ncbi:MAG: cation transporter [Deltaproteobacteria bacterium]|nr:cation transporter [Deltaproteobacteria bacterium]